MVLVRNNRLNNKNINKIKIKASNITNKKSNTQNNQNTQDNQDGYVIHNKNRRYEIILILFIITVFIGIVGFKYFFNMSWLDSFVNSGLIVSSMGPITPMVTLDQKLFTTIFAMFSTLFVIIIIALILDQIVSV